MLPCLDNFRENPQLIQSSRPSPSTQRATVIMSAFRVVVSDFSGGEENEATAKQLGICARSQLGAWTTTANHVITLLRSERYDLRKRYVRARESVTQPP